ncbi:MAG: SRPBCC family protein [Chloroflexi bacterium]|nr:SRPBCC family protein [Chloroflexota bacterium]
MPHVEQTIVIHAPVALAWERITTLANLPRWLDGVAAVRALSTAQTQPGTTFEIVRAGQPDAEHWIVLDWQPQRSLRLTEYHQDRHLHLRLESLSEGTRLVARWEWKASRGLFQRLSPPTAQRRSLDRSLERLATLIDGERAR